GARLIDVREPGEHASGVPEGAFAIPRAQLEAEPAAHAPDLAGELLLICAAGGRSRLAAEALTGQGWQNVASVAGGVAAWRAAGLPVSAGAEDEDFLDRYSRHLRLPQVGLDGQRRLATASVLLLGAGGL